jgi:hypothetical protein
MNTNNANNAEDGVKTIIEKIVRMLVDDQESVKVNEVAGESSSLFEVTVAPDDTGKIIGKRGIHADAIRILLLAISGSTHRRYTLLIYGNG